jgi:drug/metabolite transporter (DMT)-like permease
MATASRSPRLGYALAATAATLWALNGSLAKFLLDDGMPPERLAELVLLLVWLKLVHRRALPAGLWSAAGLSLVGCVFVVRTYDPGALDGIGIAEAAGAAVTFAVYLFASEQAGQRYAPATTLAWGFGLSSLFWAMTQPLWSFPLHALAPADGAARRGPAPVE